MKILSLTPLFNALSIAKRILMVWLLLTCSILADSGVGSLGLGKWDGTSKSYLASAIVSSGRPVVHINVLLTFGADATIDAVKSLQSSVGKTKVIANFALAFPETDFSVTNWSAFWRAFEPSRAYTTSERDIRYVISSRAAKVRSSGVANARLILLLEDQNCPTLGHYSNLVSLVGAAAQGYPIVRSPILYSQTLGSLRVNGCAIETHGASPASGLASGDAWCTDGVDVLLTSTDTSSLTSISLSTYVSRARAAEAKGVVPMIWWLEASMNSYADRNTLKPWNRTNIKAIKNTTERDAIAKAIKLSAP